MPTIGQKGHRAEYDAAEDFGDHHDGSQPDDEPGSAFIAGVMGSEEDVFVRPLFERMRVHCL
jgi:hypothetical protein